MRFSRAALLTVSSLLWLCGAFFLLRKGLVLWVAAFSSSGEVSSLLVVGATFCASVALGAVKGKFAMRRAVQRIVHRLQSYAEPFGLHKLFTPAYTLLLLSMVCLGFLFRWMQLPPLVQAFFDTVIGTALLVGVRYSLGAVGALRKKCSSCPSQRQTEHVKCSK